MKEIIQFPILEEREKNDYANYRHMFFTIPILLDSHVIAETGLGGGHSTRIWMEAMRQMSKPRFLFTFETSPNKDVYNECAILAHKYDIHWCPVTGKSVEEVVKLFPNKLGAIDLLYLDSDHSYENVLAELHAFQPYLSVKACILLDDTFIDGFHTDVYKAAKEWANQNNWKYLDFTETRGFGPENIRTNGKMLLYTTMCYR
jgi:cephalosporin hydroxylase